MKIVIFFLILLVFTSFTKKNAFDNENKQIEANHRSNNYSIKHKNYFIKSSNLWFDWKFEVTDLKVNNKHGTWSQICNSLIITIN
jgi:hypothetical protein